MSYARTEVWRTFRFPLLLGIVSGIVCFRFGGSTLTQDQLLLVSIVIGFWMFCVPFGFRTIEYMMSRLTKGFWIIPGIIYIVWWSIKLAISIQFAPIFLLIHIIALLYRLINYKSSLIRNEF
ncbi:hypothetical protein [Bacillus taeanensis]|uniref:Uncharacterized protein n=1 Tax=Bacillus taeanensis TaxID=273032 RepID=A0A366XPE1_9BACI|nr:hypothetical protein [Bacillus taeanensis]RBW68230.1 hypothetical protein DS031_17795 [Bacillus taeanensis]